MPDRGPVDSCLSLPVGSRCTWVKEKRSKRWCKFHRIRHIGGYRSRCRSDLPRDRGTFVKEVIYLGSVPLPSCPVSFATALVVGGGWIDSAQPVFCMSFGVQGANTAGAPGNSATRLWNRPEAHSTLACNYRCAFVNTPLIRANDHFSYPGAVWKVQTNCHMETRRIQVVTYAQSSGEEFLLRGIDLTMYDRLRRRYSEFRLTEFTYLGAYSKRILLRHTSYIRSIKFYDSLLRRIYTGVKVCRW